MVLSEAGNFAEQLHDRQKQLTAIREDLDAICHPRVRRESPMVPDPSTRIDGKSWAEEMDICDPIKDGNDVSSTAIRNEVSLVDVGPWTEEHLKRGFVLMKKNDRRQLRNVFSLPKVAVTKTPSLDPVMAAQCSKNTKANDKTLAHLQALTLDAVGPLTDLLEKLNSDATEIDTDEVGYAVESAITLIGNASS